VKTWIGPSPSTRTPIPPMVGAISRRRKFAALRPRGDVDGLIAATAIVHDLVLVTRNVSDFEDIHVPIVDPWDRG